MNSVIKKLNSLIEKPASWRLFKSDFAYHPVRASMILVFLPFGYQKWFAYEAETLIPFVRNRPLIFWMYPVFAIRGASWLLGASEWLFAALLFLFWGFWNKKAGVFGALGCCFAMIGTVTIIPFMPDGWDTAAGFPAMKGNVAFLMKDVILLAAAVYLVKQDVVRASRAALGRGERRDVTRGSVPAAEPAAAMVDFTR
jgi:uncharacterized membrane protein YkgB